MSDRLLTYIADLLMVTAGVTIGHGWYWPWIPLALAAGAIRAWRDLREEPSHG